jgi:hypothetical protein
MRKPLLLVALKAAVILYFAACANVEDDVIYKSVTPVVTKGSWKVNLYMDANQDKTNDFAGYTFSFSGSGEVTAVKNGSTVQGNWYEDNITKRLLINLGSADPTLVSLNDAWDVSDVSTTNVNLQGNAAGSTERLIITNQ